MLAVVSLNHVKSGTTTDDPYEKYCIGLETVCGGDDSTIPFQFQKFQPDRGWAEKFHPDRGATCDTKASHVQCTDWIRAVAKADEGTAGDNFGATHACFNTHLAKAKAYAAKPLDAAKLERECLAAAGAINTVGVLNGTNDCMSCDDLLDLQCGAAEDSDERKSYLHQKCGCAPQH